MRCVTATRYVTPLREGGSLPALVEADDDGLYVLKFCGAAQGPKALVAELIAGEIGRALGLPVPEIVFAQVDPVLGRTEPDEAIRQLIKGSIGLNLALKFLPGALTFDSSDVDSVDQRLASHILWFDAYVSNVDRTIRNTNMLLWHKEVMLIDHGAALYFHHNWPTYRDHMRSPFSRVTDHVLLRVAGGIPEADATARKVLSAGVIEGIVDLVPDDWLACDPYFPTAREYRGAYCEYLGQRLCASEVFTTEAEHARKRLV
jgi:hypothetical protein